MALDFTKLEKLAYRDFDTPEQQRAKDEMLEAGFTLVEEDKANPFIGAEAPRTPLEPPLATEGKSTLTEPQKPLKRPLQSRTEQGYKTLYRTAWDFHKKYSPPRADNAYWNEAAAEMAALAYAHDNNPFLMALLLAAYEELEREAKAAYT